MYLSFASTLNHISFELEQVLVVVYPCGIVLNAIAERGISVR